MESDVSVGHAIVAAEPQLQQVAEQEPPKKKVQFGLQKFFQPGAREYKPVLEEEKEKRPVGRPPKALQEAIELKEKENAALKEQLAAEEVSAVVCLFVSFESVGCSCLQLLFAVVCSCCLFVGVFCLSV